jgi:hypothetical protein
MASVRFKFAVLKVLAKWPDRRISLDEIRREIGSRIVNEGPVDEPNCISALADIDIFRSELLSQNELGLQITKAGLSFLQALKNSDEPFHATSSAFASQPIIGSIDRMTDLEERSEMSGTEPIELHSPSPEPRGGDHHEGSETGGGQSSGTPIDAPAFLNRGFGSRLNTPRQSSAPSSPFAFITQKRQSALNVWRHHFWQDTSVPRIEQSNGQTSGAAFALLSLITVLACLGAVIAFVQIRSLRSDIAALRRELLPLKTGLGQLELVEQARKASEENAPSQNAGLKQAGPDNAPSNVEATLNLSADEIQLIRDYIKPAPSAGSSALNIKIGDLIGSATIPLPPSLTEKVPRLAGARFTTRNGAIAISTKGSLRADVVLPRN